MSFCIAPLPPRACTVAHYVRHSGVCRLQTAADDVVDEDNFRSGPVFISGASGDVAAAVNGYYEPTLGFGMDGRVVYAKYGGGGVCTPRSIASASAPAQRRAHARSASRPHATWLPYASTGELRFLPCPGTVR